MRLNVRAKLVVLLITVALLPLLAAVAVLVVWVDRLHMNTAGEALVALAESEALVRQVALTRDAQTLMVTAAGPGVADLVALATELPPQQQQAMELAWTSRGLEDAAVQGVLANSVSRRLNDIRTAHPRIKEVIVTDRFGQVVGATNLTTDFLQADEQWWQEAFSGKVVLSDVGFDTSSRTWSIEISVPVVREGSIIGVAKSVVDVELLMRIGETSGEYLSIGGAQLELVSGDGVILYRSNVEPRSQRVPNWPATVPVLQWRPTKQEIEAFAPLQMPADIGGYPVTVPQWLVMVYIPRNIVEAPIYRVMVVTAIAGLALTTMIFIIGIVLVDRSLVRRMQLLQQAAHQVAHGDLSKRVTLPVRRLVGPDEIDDLADVFNRMIEGVHRTTRELQEANELKSNFIRVAGHELRTPVSYILGMARLLKDSNDATRLLFGIQSMGAKARRLNEIIQAMFKLMPGQLAGEAVNYAEISLQEMLEDLYIDLFPFVESRNQRLIIDMVDTIGPIKADPEKLRDIIENLTLNAIKFTPDGGVVKIRCSLQLGDRVMISVQDQGPGISESEYPKLFQPFYSGDVMTHSTGEVGYQKRGIGLGLAIVKHFVDLHHGTVQVASSPMGSTFSVTIPKEPPPAAVQLKQPRQQPE